MTIDQIKALGKDDLLNLLGLETKRSNGDFILPALAVFGVGALVGVGVGMLLAPRTGKDLRQDISHRLHNAPDVIAALPHKASVAMHRASDQVSEMIHENHS